jgi:limonene 1,2-monooxygenase
VNERYLQLMDHLDQLGYHEVWIEAPPGSSETDLNLLIGFLSEVTASAKRLNLGIGLHADSFNETSITTIVRSGFDYAAVSQASPSAAYSAAMYGNVFISSGATTPGGFNALPVNWEIYQRNAEHNNHRPDRADWRLAGPMHVAESASQARDDASGGMTKWLSHANVAHNPFTDEGQDKVESIIKSGLAVIGTPDDAVRQIQRLFNQSGGFGSYLLLDHGWASWQASLESYALFSREVFPLFKGRLPPSRKSE